MSGNNRIHKLIALACALLLASCNGQDMDPVVGGGEIVFSASADGSENEEQTKAYYAGDRYTESSKQKEHIYWNTGDVMRIYCANVDLSETGSKKYADYVVSNVVSSKKYYADIKLNSATTPVGLRWNKDVSVEHTFYGVYPSPSSSGITTSISGKKLVGNLAASQNTLSGALTSSSGNYVLAPDLKWQMMYATPKKYTQATMPSEESTFLTFTPITTAIQFTITNSVSTALVIKELDLISAGTQIAGAFTISSVSSKTGGFPTVTGASSLTDEHKTVKLVFSSPVTIAQNKTFVFTFFLAPVSDVQDLKFRIVRGGADDGATMTTRLGYTDGTYVKFSRCKKSFVTGIMVPEGIQWTIDYEPVLTEWVNDGGETITLN